MNKNRNIALIGCGYWGTILANNLLNFGIKNLYIYDFNKKNSEALKKILEHLDVIYKDLISIFTKNNIQQITKLSYGKRYGKNDEV